MSHGSIPRHDPPRGIEDERGRGPPGLQPLLARTAAWGRARAHGRTGIHPLDTGAAGRSGWLEAGRRGSVGLPDILMKVHGIRILFILHNAQIKALLDTDR